MILDRDTKFDSEVLGFLRDAGLRVKRTSRPSPWQNGLAERWIGSCRRALLDHVIALSEAHWRRLLRDSVRYHHEDRIHDALHKHTPKGRPVEEPLSGNGAVIRLTRLGGLPHRYGWRAAA